MSITYSQKRGYILSFEMEICISESYVVSRNIFAPLGMRAFKVQGSRMTLPVAKGMSDKLNAD